MSNVDLDAAGVPVAFLQSYPFPAFVLRISESPGSTPTVERSGQNSFFGSSQNGAKSGWNPAYGGQSSVEVLWGNSRWTKLLGGGDVEDLADAGAIDGLARWVTRGESNDGDTFELGLNLPSTRIILPLANSVVSSSSSAHSGPFFIITALSSGSPRPLETTPLISPSTTPPPLTDTRSEPSWRNPGGATRQGAPPAFAGNSVDDALTSTPSRPLLPKHLDCRYLLDTTDWSKTALGPRSKWSPVIETMISIVYASPTQDSLWLGPDFNMIYNQHYTQIVNHPLMFGKSAKVKEAWGPVWDGVYHLIDRCLRFGEPTYKEDDLLLYRKGPLGHFVERYHTWSFIPIHDHDGTPLGIFNPTSETTDAVLARRRQETMRDLSQELLVVRNVKEYYAAVSDVLERNPKDVPFAISYSVDEDTHQRVILQLESTIGVPSDHPAAPNTLTIEVAPLRNPSHRGSNGLSSPALSAISNASMANTSRIRLSSFAESWPIAMALSTRQCVLVEDCSSIIDGFDVREWDHLPMQAIVIPICSEMSSDAPRSVVILGLNLRCPLDEAYEDWIQILRAHLVSSLASARATEAERQRVLDLDRMDRAKTAYFQSAAHELRTPLTLVAGPLDDLLQTSLKPAQISTLNLAQRNVRRIQRLVNALLDFSRLEAGKLTGQFVPINLGQFVGDLAALFRPNLERRKIGYLVEIEPREEMVYVDPTLMETAVSNLISNAVKYTAEGTVKVFVTFTDVATISVTDTGCGIPSDEVDGITERFNRASNATTRAIEGTGIGLALTKEIVRLHDGELLITSQTAEETGGPHGSTFTIQLPLIERQSAGDGSSTVFGAYGRQMVEEVMHWGGASTNEARSDIDAASVGTNTEASKGDNTLFFDKTDVLLLVDDNVELRTYIKTIFSPYCTIVEASDGVEALAYARANTVQLILSDFMMPNMSGDQLLQAIRSDPMTQSIPMVLLSAATDEELRLSVIVQGATDYIQKPFRPRELLARIHLHMQLGKRRTQLESLFSQREQEIKVLSDLCPTGIVRTDDDGTLVYGNDAWKTHAGMDLDADVSTWGDHMNTEAGEALWATWQAFLSSEERETTIRWVWSNGKSASGTFIKLDRVNAALTGVLGCIQDTSYQEERIRDAEQRSIELEEQKRQQDLLVDFTSHEIRTPVSAILQCSSLVKENLLVLKGELEKVGKVGYIPSRETLDDLEQDLEALESIYQCGLVQERIAGDVLSLSRIQLDRLTFDYTNMDLRSSAKKVVSVFSSEAKAKQIELILEFGPSLDSTGISAVKTDHVRLGQVVTNVISNAMKFTADSPRRRITVRYEVSVVPPQEDDCWLPPPVSPSTASTGQSREVQSQVKGMKEDDPVWLFVSVQDTGPGLSDAERAVLFQRFSQGSRMVHSRFGGSGLGLYICKRISELLGGKISVQSVLGQGSTFTFYIKAGFVPPTPSEQSAKSTDINLTQSVYGTAAPPRKLSGEVEVSAAAAAETAHTAAQANSDARADANGIARVTVERKRSVLVVEDNLINQTVLKRQMIKAGWTCDVASNGQEALDRLEGEKGQGRRYDVVLMDLEMPVMDGLTAVSRIRHTEEANHNETRQLVIALTGNARQGQIDQAFAAGMDDVVIKPYKLPNLLEKLKAAVTARQSPAEDA